jgi:hypothetical protein
MKIAANFIVSLAALGALLGAPRRRPPTWPNCR